MGKTCIQCGNKMGFFQKPVDGIYCSMDCSALAQQEIAKTEQLAVQVRADQQRADVARVEQDTARKADDVVKAQRRATCPKCGQPWQVVEAAGSEASGECKRCGFSATFLDIEVCPGCTGDTLVVESESIARCPRCKYRRG